MSADIPKTPAGTGRHPIALVVISANDLAASEKFYAEVFGWRTQPLTKDLVGISLPAGPFCALRSGVPDGFPGVVPYLAVDDVDGGLERVVGKGGRVERATWSLPGLGRLARFHDPSGTLYGLTDAASPGGAASIPAPFGSNPRPLAGTVCSLEMYVADGGAAAGWFGELFGWGTLQMMPQYMSFDPGAGISGVFQSHTPTLRSVAYLYATDVEARLAEIETAGGRRMGEPMRVPGLACFAYFTDPSGTPMGMIGD